MLVYHQVLSVLEDRHFTKSDVDYSEGDPFATNQSIYVFYTFTGTDFCGHAVSGVLDLDCNILTVRFTPSFDVRRRVGLTIVPVYKLL